MNLLQGSLVCGLVLYTAYAFTQDKCIEMLQDEGYLPHNWTHTYTFVPKNFTDPPGTNSSICVVQVFGTHLNGTLPYNNLVQFTTPAPTKSPEQIRDEFCEYTDWAALFEAKWCHKPCDPCVQHYLNMTNEYLLCLEHNNGIHPYKPFEKEPMMMALHLNRFGAHINKYNYVLCKFFPRYHVFTNLLWNMDQKFRYGNFRVPDYRKKTNIPFKRKRWNKRNDTIEVPYGNLPRGVYTYSVVMYEKIIDKLIPYENTRYKDEWPETHPIITGIFIDTRVEPDLVFNKTYEINSALISVDIQGPASLTDYPTNPLPGEMVISFTHYNRSYRNPLCVYWQQINSADPNKLPIGGYWSNYGQRVFKTNESMTVCRSTHAGIFALLMEPDVPPPEKPIEALNALNILLSLIAGILFFIYIFLMFLLRCAKDVYNRVYIALAFSCLLSQMFYLGAWDWRDDWDRCTGLASLIEFCHVAIMTWIMIESVHQLSRLRYFFNESTSAESFYHIIGWGFPITITIALFEFPFEEYEVIRYCWPYIHGHDIWYFGGPILVLLLVTMSLKAITVYEIRKVPPEMIFKDINYERAQRSLLASIAIIPTFLVMWLFSTLAVQSGIGIMEDVAMLAVPLLNISLALEIMYFYFYRNDEVIDSVLYEMRIREKEKLKSYEYMRGLNMRVQYVAGEECLIKDGDFDNSNTNIKETNIDDEEDDGGHPKHFEV